MFALHSQNRRGYNGKEASEACRSSALAHCCVLMLSNTDHRMFAPSYSPWCAAATTRTGIFWTQVLEALQLLKESSAQS